MILPKKYRFQKAYNSTMLVCDEINKEVKSLRMEVASLKTTLEEEQTGRLSKQVENYLKGCR